MAIAVKSFLLETFVFLFVNISLCFFFFILPGIFKSGSHPLKKKKVAMNSGKVSTLTNLTSH